MTTRCRYYIHHRGEETLAPLPGDEVNERDNAPGAIFFQSRHREALCSYRLVTNQPMGARIDNGVLWMNVGGHGTEDTIMISRC
jgi:hypothetical protein